MIIQFIHTIFEEMYKGNFSLPILIVGILQLIEMRKRRKSESTESIPDDCKAEATLSTETLFNSVSPFLHDK